MEIKLFIIDKFSIVRDGIKALFIDNPNMTVLGMSESYSKHSLVIPLCHVLLLEHENNTETTISLLDEIKEQHPDLKIILLADNWEEPLGLHKLLLSGIDGYLTKTTSCDELIYAIKVAHSDELFISTKFVLEFIEQCLPVIKAENVTIAVPELSLGETEVLNLISDGLTNREIANQLQISVRTIETRRKSLLDKTNTTTTATLIKFCVQAGIIG